jgi:acyl carrier protein
VEKLLKIFREVFDDPNIEISSSNESIDNWDSFSHMDLILSLENEFEITFTNDEIVEMLNIKKIFEILKTKDVKLNKL